MPKLLGLNKVDPMLSEVFAAFDLVVFKLHTYTPLAYLVKGGLNLRLTAHGILLTLVSGRRKIFRTKDWRSQDLVLSPKT